MMIYYSPEVFPSAQLKIGRDPKGKESFLRVGMRTLWKMKCFRDRDLRTFKKGFVSSWRWLFLGREASKYIYITYICIYIYIYVYMFIYISCISYSYICCFLVETLGYSRCMIHKHLKTINTCIWKMKNPMFFLQLWKRTARVVVMGPWGWISSSVDWIRIFFSDWVD